MGPQEETSQGDVLTIELPGALALAVAAALLFLGRRLYWLAVGGVGFAAGLVLTDAVLHLEGVPQLLAAVAGGVVGVVLAIVAQKVAVALAGLLAGAWLAWQGVVVAGLERESWAWLAILAGAILGVALSAFLFDTALVAISSVAGAMLAVYVLALDAPHDAWVFIGLLALGVTVQSQTRPRRRSKDDEKR